MVPSRLAFHHEFARELGSAALRDWFEIARQREPVLQPFPDPLTLRQFIQAEDRHPAKPEIWQALVRNFQNDPGPSTIYLLGLLAPVLDHLVERFDGDDLDPEDLWQETITCALAALSNPKLPQRRAVLAGILLDTVHQLRHWLRRELSRAKNVGPLLEEMSATSVFDVEVSPDEEALLVKLCERTGVAREGFALIRLTRLQRRPLTDLAPHLSAAYFRLSRRRAAAEKRLTSWLAAHPDWSREGTGQG